MLCDFSKLTGFVMTIGTLAHVSEAHALPDREGATYYGDTGSDLAEHVEFNLSNQLVVVGGTGSSGMATTGAWDTGLTGTKDAFVSLWQNASTRLWSTYYGGLGEDSFYGVTVNEDNDIYAVGTTTSGGFIASLDGAQLSLSGADDAMLIKFDDTGSRVWGTYFGGPGSESDFNNTNYPSVCVAPDGSVYIVGRTTSTTGIATMGAHKSSLTADADAFIAKFSSAGAKLWATYYGGTGTGRTGANGCAVDSAGNVYVAGETESTSGIWDSPGFDNSFAGSWDAFLVKFNSSGVIQWGTYYGGTEYEKFNAIGIDSSDNVYVAGHTWSSSGIASVGAPDASLGGGTDGFVVKFTAAGTRSWGTYFGGAEGDGFSDIYVASYGTIYLGGSTKSTGITTPDAFDSTYTLDTSQDGLIVAMNPSTGAATYVTYNGGTNDDRVHSVAADTSGGVAAAGWTRSSDSIATIGAFDTTQANSLSADAFITWIRMFFV